MNCFAEACTIIRRALGYTDRNACLERLWYAEEGPRPRDVPELLAGIFPDRHIIIASPFQRSYYKNLPDNFIYVGKNVPDPVDQEWYLWLFSYRGPDSKKSHVVVGWPWSASPEMIIDEIIGISVLPSVTRRKGTLRCLIEKQARDDDAEQWEADEAFRQELAARVTVGSARSTIDLLQEEIRMLKQPVEEPAPAWEPLKPSRIVMKIQREPEWVDIRKRR